jgi:HAD superfamily hydrolase (TIGR01509 family)
VVFPRRIEAVVFDMDGLLIDSEGLVRVGMKRAAATMGVDLPDSLCSSMIGLPFPECKSMIVDHFGPDFPMEAFLVEERREIEALFVEGVALKAGVRELLAHVDALGLPRAVATSSGRASVALNLGQHGLLEGFKAIVSREDVQRHKPYPDPYLRAAERLGVAPAACLALEDSHNGVRAAHAAGMMTVMVPDLLHPTEEMHAMCARIADSLHEVLELLRAHAAHHSHAPEAS